MNKGPADYPHLKEPLTIEVNEFVSMHIEQGSVSFYHKYRDNLIFMTEWELGEALDKYLGKKLDERFRK